MTPRSDVEQVQRILALNCHTDEYEEANAALARLSERVEYLERDVGAIQLEREHALARVEELERERGEDYWHKRMCEYIDRLEAAEAERDRLREALREIAGMQIGASQAVLVARRALAPPDVALAAKFSEERTA